MRKAIATLAVLGFSLSKCGGSEGSAAIDAGIGPKPYDEAGVDGAAVDATGPTDATGSATDSSATTDTKTDAPVVAACAHGGPVAFPGAEGFGACVTGGRGGKVVHVTSLAASGAGSLQSALDQKGKRTIVFDVSGVVGGIPELTNGDVTLAGESSPGGVILRGLLVQGDSVCEQDGCPLPKVAPNNVLVRFLRLRPAGLGDDGLRLHRAKNVMIDHVSIGNASDEAVQISLSSDLTIQDTLLAETLVSGHDVEYGGMLINYSDPTRGYPLTRLSIHHNLWNRLAGRLPELSRENHKSDEGKISEIELASNVVWDPRAPLPIATRSGPWSDGGPVYWHLNFVDNYFVVRKTFQYGMTTIGGIAPGAPTTLYFSGNQLSIYPKLFDWQLDYCCNDFPAAVASGDLPKVPAYSVKARHSFPSITYDPAGDALVARAVAKVGCFPRDPMDRRLMNALSTKTFDDTALDKNPKADALLLDFTKPPAAEKDSDGDGIPDVWEIANGLASTDATDGAKTGLSSGKLGVPGYTNLEVYLFDRVSKLVK